MEQIQSDLRLIFSSLSGNRKKEIGEIISRTKNSDFLITEATDSFVLLFEDLIMDKKMVNVSMIFLSIIRSLIESELISSCACVQILNVIKKYLNYSPNEQLILKVFQIVLALFASNLNECELRIIGAEIIFKTETLNLTAIKNIILVTSFQLLDITFEKIFGKKIQTERRKSFDPEQNDEAFDFIIEFEKPKETNIISQFSPNNWSIHFIITLINDLICFLNNEEPGVFTDVFSQNDFPIQLLKYIIENHFKFIRVFQSQFSDTFKKLYHYILDIKDPLLFSMFAKSIIVYNCQNEPDLTRNLLIKLCDFLKSNHFIIFPLVLIIFESFDTMIDLIGENKLFEITEFAASLFFTYMKVLPQDAIKITNNRNTSMNDYNPQSQVQIFKSSILFIYYQIPKVSQKMDYFVKISDLFINIWENLIRKTNDMYTVLVSIKFTNLALKIALNLNMINYIQQFILVLSEICTENKQGFNKKSLICLHSLVHILQKMNTKIIDIWSLFFDTFSKCNYIANSTKTAFDSKVRKVLQLTIINFQNINEKQFEFLFDIILSLSIQEFKAYINQIIKSPNFYPLNALCSLFINNLNFAHNVESNFYDHLNFIIQKNYIEYQIIMINISFDIAKAIVNCDIENIDSNRIFELIFSIINSNNQDLLEIGIDNILSFVKSVQPENIKNGWSTIITLIKNIWVNPTQQNVQNGYTLLELICNEFLSYLNKSVYDIYLSTVSSFVSETFDNSLPIKTLSLIPKIMLNLQIEDQEIFNNLFKILQNQLHDKRKEVIKKTIEILYEVIEKQHSMFTQETFDFITNCVLHNVIQIDISELFILKIKTVIQILTLIKHFDKAIIYELIGIFETMPKRDSEYSSEIIKCLIPLFFFDDQELLKQITRTFQKLISNYIKKRLILEIKSSCFVIKEVFPKIILHLDETEIMLWFEIIESFFSLGSQYNDVLLSLLEIFQNIPQLTDDKYILITKYLTHNINAKNNFVLKTKNLEILSFLLLNVFNETTRAKTFKFLISSIHDFPLNEFKLFLSKFILVPISSDILLKDDEILKKMIEIIRKYKAYREYFIQLITPNMNLISEKLLPLYFLVVKDSPIFYQLYFENICHSDEFNFDFASKTKDIVKGYFSEFVKTLISEEDAIGSVLLENRYNEIINFLSVFNNLESNEQVFESHGNFGHIYFLFDDLSLLYSSRSKNLREIVLKTLKKICC